MANHYVIVEMVQDTIAGVQVYHDKEKAVKDFRQICKENNISEKKIEDCLHDDCECEQHDRYGQWSVKMHTVENKES